MEDYALLAGSLALFVILTAVLYYTRQVNWYRLGDHSD
jgi:inner membrane protein involved in colicin E2 resistance